MAESEAETVERLAEERAIEIIDALKSTYFKHFAEELSDEVIVEQIQIKIKESQAALIQHQLRQLCATVLEPADYFRAKKMLIERNKPVIQPSESADVQPKRGRATRSK